MLRLGSAEFSVPRLLPAEGMDELANHIVNVNQGHLVAGIVDLDGQVVRDVVAKSRDRRVVVRPAPLAEQIGKPVDQHFCASLLRIAEQQVLPGFFGLSIGVVKLRLDRGGEHDRAGVAVLFQQVEQR